MLAPDRAGEVARIYRYVTGLIAAKFGIEIHAVQMLSTHIHEVLTDVNGMLPRFLEQRNRLFANALKCFRGWPEEVFSREGANCVELFGPTAIEKEMLYTLANCVEAGLVSTPNEWPGVNTPVEELGRKAHVVSRPRVYFSEEMPKDATFETTIPKALIEAHGTAHHARRAIESGLHERVAALHRAFAKAGRTYLGVAKVLAARFTARSNAFESFGARVPSFAAAGVKEAATLALSLRATFLRAYRKAFEAFRAGERTVPFPFGTWRMRFVAGAYVAQA